MSNAFSSDAAGKLDVFGHDGDALGVNGTEVGVLEKPNHVGLSCFLESEDRLGLEAQIRLVLLGNFPDEALER